MNIEEVLAKLQAPPVMREGANYAFPELRPHVQCADGTTVSIQASWSHYCQPRDNEGPFFAFELLYGGDFAELAPFRDGDGSQIYGYVPVEVVQRLLEHHGGPYGEVTA